MNPAMAIRNGLFSSMRFSVLLGYNTNGFAHHTLPDALEILASLGYRGVAITLDYHALNPYSPQRNSEVKQIRSLLQTLGLRCVIETGSRFLLDRMHKHQPTLLSADPQGRKRRLDFLIHAIQIASELDADAVSFWSGTPDTPLGNEELFSHLVSGCRQLARIASDLGVRLAFEPEPGMFIDHMDRFRELHQAVDRPHFGLTLDIGHLHCLGETPIQNHLLEWQNWLWNIHIEDMRAGVHDHLMFGDGEIDFHPVLHALEKINYRGGVYVELSRHSHDAVNTACKSLQFLKNCLGKN